jgi:hypothetical protein
MAPAAAKAGKDVSCKIRPIIRSLSSILKVFGGAGEPVAEKPCGAWEQAPPAGSLLAAQP